MVHPYLCHIIHYLSFETAFLNVTHYLFSGFPDKKTTKLSHFNNDPGNSASMVNKCVHYLISSCLLILLTILSHNR